jgi:hypothetical protein
MLLYSSIFSIAAESHCRRASTTGCYLPASPPKGTVSGITGSLRASLLSGAILYATSRRTSQPGTVHIERVNGTLRDRLNALTRKTHAFAKRDETFDALVFLQLFEHNWIRPHHALRVLMPDQFQRYQPRTPAMALGLTEHPWSWITFLTTSVYTTPK